MRSHGGQCTLLLCIECNLEPGRRTATARDRTADQPSAMTTHNRQQQSVSLLPIPSPNRDYIPGSTKHSLFPFLDMFDVILLFFFHHHQHTTSRCIQNAHIQVPHTDTTGCLQRSAVNSGLVRHKEHQTRSTKLTNLQSPLSGPLHFWPQANDPRVPFFGFSHSSVGSLSGAMHWSWSYDDRRPTTDARKGKGRLRRHGCPEPMPDWLLRCVRNNNNNNNSNEEQPLCLLTYSEGIHLSGFCPFSVLRAANCCAYT